MKKLTEMSNISSISLIFKFLVKDYNNGKFFMFFFDFIAICNRFYVHFEALYVFLNRQTNIVTAVFVLFQSKNEIILKWNEMKMKWKTEIRFEILS